MRTIRAASESSTKLFKVVAGRASETGIEIAENCGMPIPDAKNCIVPAKSYNISNAEIDKKQRAFSWRRLS